MALAASASFVPPLPVPLPAPALPPITPHEGEQEATEVILSMLAVTLVRAAETVAQATAAPPLLELPRRFEFRSGPPDAKSVAVTGGGENKTELSYRSRKQAVMYIPMIHRNKAIAANLG